MSYYLFKDIFFLFFSKRYFDEKKCSLDEEHVDRYCRWIDRQTDRQTDIKKVGRTSNHVRSCNHTDRPPKSNLPF